MRLESIGMAFQEEEYAQLDEYCQVELAARRSMLLQKAPAKETIKSVNCWPFILTLVAIVCFFGVCFMMGEAIGETVPVPGRLFCLRKVVTTNLVQ